MSCCFAAYDEAFEKEFGADMSENSDSDDDQDFSRDADLKAGFGRQQPGGGTPGAVTTPISDNKHETHGEAQTGVNAVNAVGQHDESTAVDSASSGVNDDDGDAWSWAERWEQEQWEKNNKIKNGGSHTAHCDGAREGQTNGGDDGIGEQMKRRMPSRSERIRRDFGERGDAMRDSVGNSSAPGGGGGLVSLDALTTIMNAATADQIGDVDHEGHARGPCRCCRGDQRGKQETRGDGVGGGNGGARDISKKCCFAFASRGGWKGPGGAFGSRTLTLFHAFRENNVLLFFVAQPLFSFNNVRLIQLTVFFRFFGHSLHKDSHFWALSFILHPGPALPLAAITPPLGATHSAVEAAHRVYQMALARLVGSSLYPHSKKPQLDYSTVIFNPGPYKSYGNGS